MINNNKVFKVNTRRRISRRKGNYWVLLVLCILLCTFICVKGNQQREIKGYTYDCGSTVWEIAQRNCPDDMDIRDFVSEIEKANGIKNHIVYSGMTYKIPVYEEK